MYTQKPGKREIDTIGPFRKDSIVSKRFKGPLDVPKVDFTQAQIDTMSQSTYNTLPIFFKPKKSIPTFANQYSRFSKKKQ